MSYHRITELDTSTVFRLAFLAMAITLSCITACEPGARVHTKENTGSKLPALSVSKNHIVNQTGDIIRLIGVNRSGAEYACAEGSGIWDGPTDTDPAIRAMAAWHINAVRIPLNEDCWLGINGAKPAYSGASYQSAIAAYVTRLERFGMTPILNLHYSAPGRSVPDGQAPMADEDHSPSFWRSLATYFRNDHHVIFDLFNEPFPDSNRDTPAAWYCVLNGGTCPGVSFRAAGMQQLVDVVRAAGATQPLMIAGPQYAGDLDHWLQYEPRDPLHQLIATIHIYEPGWAPCDAQACWVDQIAGVAAKVPVVEGEIGSKNCAASSIGPLLNWSDANGVSYLAWAWNVGSCSAEPSLITDYSGTPTHTYGQCYHDHLLALSEQRSSRGGQGCGLLASRRICRAIRPLRRGRRRRCAAEPTPDEAIAPVTAWTGLSWQCSVAKGGVVVRKLVLIAGCLVIAAGLAVAVQAVSVAQSGKLVVIVEENESYTNIVGNSQAPYLNQLISQGQLFTNYTAVADGSNPNYLAMTSGLTSFGGSPPQNIFQKIDGTGGGVTWKEFMESAPGNCADGNSTNIPGTNVALYTADHDPAYSYRSNTTCNANDVPMTSSTFNPANLPSLSYIVPNECNDMHTVPGSGQACPSYYGPNTGSSLIGLGDSWLAHVVPQLLAQPGVTVLVTWDEWSGGTTPTEHIATVEAGAGVTPGSTDGTAYTHYGLEAGLYKFFGLGTAPNNGAAATPVPFGGGGGPTPTPSTTSPTPTATTTSPTPTPTTTSPTPTPTTTSPTPTPTGSCPGGITVDPATPAAVRSKYGVSSVSTAGFSPPAGSLLEVVVNALQGAPGGDTVTVTDSKGDVFTAGPHIAATKAPNSSWFFQFYESSAPGSLTVTAHQAGSNLGTLQLAVQVLDGAAATQSGAAAGTFNGTTGTKAQTHALTNTQAGSWLYVAVGNGDSGSALTPVAGQANVDVWLDPSSGNDGAVGRLPTTGTGPQLVGWTASQSDPFEWAAQEVLHC